jgi:hypothetical protein
MVTNLVKNKRDKSGSRRDAQGGETPGCGSAPGEGRHE